MPDMIFGEVKTDDGHAVAAGLTFDNGQLLLTSDTRHLGAWPADQVAVDPIDSHTVRIVIGGESVQFVTEHPDDTARVLDARRVGTTSMWVAAAPGVWERAEASVSASRPAPRPSIGHLVAPIVAVVASATIAFSGFSLMQRSTDAGPENPAQSLAAVGPMESNLNSAPVQTPTTVAVPEGVPDVIAPPGTPLIEVTDTWNRLAEEYQTFLLLADGARVGRWGSVSVEFITTEFGMVSGATLRGDTTGNAQSDRTILMAMGQLVAAVDPSLDGPGRRALLARLGVDVDLPRLEGFGGTLVSHGVEYSLDYDAATRVIRFEASLSLG